MRNETKRTSRFSIENFRENNIFPFLLALYISNVQGYKCLRPLQTLSIIKQILSIRYGGRGQMHNNFKEKMAINSAIPHIIRKTLHWQNGREKELAKF